VLFIVLIFFFMLVFLSVLTVLYHIITKRYFEQTYSAVKIKGIVFTVLNYVGVSLLFGIPLWSLYIGKRYYIIACISAVFNIIASCFISKYRSQIALYFC
jgi:hypothetical protein